MNPTVLLIDKNIAVTEIVKALLIRNGYSVDVLRAGEDVLEYLAEKPVDIIVSDVQSDNANGFQLVRSIRSDPATADIPLVYLTAAASLEDEFEAYLSGADAFITKPFRARDLLAAIDNALNRKPMSTSSGRLAVVQDVARVLACVADERHRLVRQALKQAGFELEFESGLDRAFSRVDRERFHLLICDMTKDPDAVRQVRDFVSHFALAIPVVFLHGKDQAPRIPANDPQFVMVRLPTTPVELAQKIRKAIVDFGGPP
ncbi:MAG: response regulator transcription factor [Planctomycetes bacterium]|nr:response regulator transcription factor [Planctomycetota bacterium]